MKLEKDKYNATKIAFVKNEKVTKLGEKDEAVCLYMTKLYRSNWHEG